MPTLLPILFVLLLVSCVVGLILQHVFLSRLRTRHARTWEALGRPTLFLNNSISNSLAVLRFLWRREYRDLADNELIRFAAFLRGYLVAYLLLFVLVVAGFVLSTRRQ